MSTDPKIYRWSNSDSLRAVVRDVLATKPIHTGQWQAMDVRQSPMHATHELEDVTIHLPSIPMEVGGLQELLHPDLPWAEDHFQERVSGTPHNPAPSHAWWPYAVRSNTDHTDGMGQFDHTYPERFWPKMAEGGRDGCCQDIVAEPHRGIRFAYGDLMDVVNLLVHSPLTRQAYLPVWFPEDTGASGQKDNYHPHRDGDLSPIRVPCTLGYHFMIRDGLMSCRYYMRSCDVYRHLTNDIYLACRLTQWMVDQVQHRGGEDLVGTGRLVMHISSLHSFAGDTSKIIKRMFHR